ncbi:MULTISPECIES: hypothetical protein [Luteimonas]|uniref:hypothetical protein n=1 Tax=Luteimonas TaxID=83614 RepID=UPI0013042B0A|nr:MULTISPECIES: hypothetical protein [Luteimonas]
MSERSEFGRRALSFEKRREPARRSRVGSCPATAVLLTFDKTKVSRANSAEALFFASQLHSRVGRERTERNQLQGFRPLARASSFLKDQKGTKKSCRRTLADAMKPHRSPALLA